MIKSKVYTQVDSSFFQVNQQYLNVVFSMLLAVLMLAGVWGTTAVYAATPIFTEDGPFSIGENSSTGTIVGQVVATDATTYTITAGNGTGGGAFLINNDGTFQVVDGTQLDYEVTTQFTLTVEATNNDGTTAATVLINVLNVNDPPQMQKALYEFLLDENLPNGTLVGTVSATDKDSGDTVTYSILPGSDGSYFAIDSDDGEIKIADTDGIDFESGKIQYTFFVQATDGGLNDFATIIVTIDDANDVPVAVDDSYTTTEDTDKIVADPAEGVLANDTDQDPADVGNLTAVLDTQPANGTVTLNADGTFTYSPNPQFDGTDSFTYQANDGDDNSNIATVTINVDGTNNDPTANDDIEETNEDTILNVPADGVLANDTDPENDPLTVSGSDTTSTMGATVSVSADGSFSYDPTGSAAIQALDAGDAAVDTFDYTISDGDTGTGTATVSINLSGLNDAPVAGDDTDFTDEDTVLNVAAPGVLGNDSDIDVDDNPSVSDFDAPSTMGAAVSVSADGSFTYDPTGSAALQALKAGDPPILDTFTYEISDGFLTDTATMTVTVTAVNDDPTAKDDTLTVNEDSTNNTLKVLSNDSPTPETEETLTITAVGATNNGGLAINNITDITYTPALNFNGTEVFTYTISDGNGGFDTATVTVNVKSRNDDPIITEGISVTVNIDEDENPMAFALTLNATDVDGDTITWSISTPSSNGAASANGTGISKDIGYTPNADYFGTDSFVVQVSDGNEGIDDITVHVKIASQNDDPTAVDDFPDVPEQSSNITLYVLANDLIEPDESETLTITAVGATDNGGSTINNGTDITYTPAPTFIGTEVFTYTISDGNGGFDTATVNVNVQDVNFAPVITEGVAIGVTMSEDGTPTAFSLTLNATDADVDTLTWSIFSQGSNGTASASGSGNSKTINYSPNVDYNGTDNFIVRVSDGQGGTDNILVEVTINPENDDPTAVDDNASTAVDTAALIYVLTNDDDIDGDGLSVSAATNGTNGTVTNHGTHVEYTPTTGYEGIDSFTYTANDGNGGTSVATVTVVVGKAYVTFLPMIVKPGPQAPDLVVTDINASSDLIEVVIENQGNAPVFDSFWVDFYINPNPAPTAANELWPELGSEGLAWGVTNGVAVGETITLTFSTELGAPNLYFVAGESVYHGSLPAGTPVYAQVDSAHAGIGNGAITELDELGYGPYNNILGDVALAIP